MGEEDASGSHASQPDSTVDRWPALLLLVFGIACQELLKRLTEASWEATLVVVLALGPWTVLLAIQPRPSPKAMRRITATTAGLLLAAGAAWALVACFDGSNDGVACSSDYEGACVPEGVTDVDCAEINARGFRSVGSDPYNLDSNGDGIACE
jgi:hypothetical protein